MFFFQNLLLDVCFVDGAHDLQPFTIWDQVSSDVLKAARKDMEEAEDFRREFCRTHEVWSCGNRLQEHCSWLESHSHAGKFDIKCAQKQH